MSGNPFPEGAEPVATRGRATAAAAIVFAHTIKHIYNSGMTSLIMPEVKIGLGLTRAQFGSLATATAIAWWTSTMVSGYLGDRFSNHAGRMLAISMTLMGIAFFLVGLAPNYLTMLAVMFLAGIGPSMFHPPGIGGAGPSVSGPPRLRGRVSWSGRQYRRGVRFSHSGRIPNFPGLAGPDGRESRPGAAGSSGRRAARAVQKDGGPWGDNVDAGVLRVPVLLLRNRILLLLIVATALRSVGETAVSGFLTLYMREDLGYSRETVALFISVSQVAGIISLPIMGFLTDRVGSKPVLVVGTGLVMLSALGVAVAQPGYQLFLIVLVRGAFTFSLHHVFIAAALNSAPGTNQSTVVSLVYGAGWIGTFSPYVAGLISDEFGIHSAFLYGGSVLVLPTLLLLFARFPRRPVQPAEG